MADHRKSFRPRRLGLGGRLLPRGRLLGATLILLGALAPTHAQELGLKSGTASLEAGKYEDAVRQLSATVNDDDSTPGQAAEALYLRGIAYRKMGQPGRAIADLGAALWLGLPNADKVRALVNKGLAFRAAGLSSHADAEFSRARSASSSGAVQKLIAEDGGAAVASGGTSTEVAAGGQSESGSVWSRLVPSFGGGANSSPPPAAEPAPAPEPAPQQTAAAAPSSGWDASVSDEATQPSGNRVSRWFGSITGDSAPAPPAAPSAAPQAAPAPQATAAPRTAAAPPSAESWSANTQTTRVVSEGGDSGGTAIGRWFSRTTGSSDSAPAPAPAATGGGYSVQLANSRSKAEAEALWKQVSGTNSRLASVSPQIAKVDIGSFGTFYSLRIGPFSDRAESTKVCNALKRNGTDCSVVSPDGP